MQFHSRKLYFREDLVPPPIPIRVCALKNQNDKGQLGLNYSLMQLVI